MSDYFVILHDAEPPTKEGRDALKKKLVAVLGVREESINAIFQSLPIVLKKQVRRIDAERYVEALKKLGADVEMLTEDSGDNAGETLSDNAPGDDGIFSGIDEAQTIESSRNTLPEIAPLSRTLTTSEKPRNLPPPPMPASGQKDVFELPVQVDDAVFADLAPEDPFSFSMEEGQYPPVVDPSGECAAIEPRQDAASPPPPLSNSPHRQKPSLKKDDKYTEAEAEPFGQTPDSGTFESADDANDFQAPPRIPDTYTPSFPALRHQAPNRYALLLIVGLLASAFYYYTSSRESTVIITPQEIKELLNQQQEILGRKNVDILTDAKQWSGRIQEGQLTTEAALTIRDKMVESMILSVDSDNPPEPSTDEIIKGTRKPWLYHIEASEFKPEPTPSEASAKQQQGQTQDTPQAATSPTPSQQLVSMGRVFILDGTRRHRYTVPLHVVVTTSGGESAITGTWEVINGTLSSGVGTVADLRGIVLQALPDKTFAFRARGTFSAEFRPVVRLERKIRSPEEKPEEKKGKGDRQKKSLKDKAKKTAEQKALIDEA